MSAARDEILQRTRAAIRGAAASGPVARTYQTAGTLDRAGRVELLRERLLDYHACVEHTTAGALKSAVDELAPGARIGVPPGLPEAWRPVDAFEDRGLSPLELDARDGVLTGCTVAIAETGTL